MITLGGVARNLQGRVVIYQGTGDDFWGGDDLSQFYILIYVRPVPVKLLPLYTCYRAIMQKCILANWVKYWVGLCLQVVALGMECFCYEIF